MRLIPCLLLGLVVLSNAEADPEPLRVLYVYTPNAANRIANDETISVITGTTAAGHAQTINGGLDSIIDDSGLGNLVSPEVAGTVVFTGSEYTEASANSQAGAILGDFNGFPDLIMSGSQNIEQIMTAQQADIVVVVVDQVQHEGQFVGGAAKRLEDVDGDPGNYTVLVDVDGLDGSTLAHEVGHLGGADHPDPNENTATINNNSARGYRDPAGHYGTVMEKTSDCNNDSTPACKRLKVYSRPTGSFTDDQGVVRSPIGSAQANTTGTLQQTLPRMADYAEVRASTPPPVSDVDTEWVEGCDSQAQFTVTVSVEAGTPAPDNCELVRVNQYGAIIDTEYSGGLACLILGGNGRRYQSRCRNYGGWGVWSSVQVTWQPGNCEITNPY